MFIVSFYTSILLYQQQVLDLYLVITKEYFIFPGFTIHGEIL